MAGLDPAIHALTSGTEVVDGRHEAGHDVARVDARQFDLALVS
jgi:hypothetical protein